MKIDLHLHGTFSADSQICERDLIPEALTRGYGILALTEHFDFSPWDLYHFGLPSFRHYCEGFRKLREEFGNILLIRGVEAGEYHRYHHAADSVFAMNPPEMIIGSIHLLPDGRNVSTPFLPLLPEWDVRAYYQDNLDLVRFGKIDILGHLGIYKRYYAFSPDEEYADHLVEEIFREIIRRDIALEVNYSACRKPLHSILPSVRHLEIYRSLGGELLTIGSDAHSQEDFDDFYGQTLQTLRSLGFGNVYYKLRNQWNRLTLSQAER